jgi:hypothetical protein
MTLNFNHHYAMLKCQKNDHFFVKREILLKKKPKEFFKVSGFHSIVCLYRPEILHFEPHSCVRGYSRLDNRFILLLSPGEYF